MAVSSFLSEGAAIPQGSALTDMTKQQVLPEWYTNYAMDILSGPDGTNTAYVVSGQTLHTLDLASGKPTTVGAIKGLTATLVDIAATAR